MNVPNTKLELRIKLQLALYDIGLLDRLCIDSLDIEYRMGSYKVIIEFLFFKNDQVDRFGLNVVIKDPDLNYFIKDRKENLIKTITEEVQRVPFIY